MKVLFLVVNTTCDIACRHCFYTQGYQTRSTSRIMPHDAETFAQKIVQNGFTTVILSGGDPLCSQFKHETYVLIKKLKEKNLRVLVNTSAVKLHEDDINAIVGLNIDRIDISINSLVRSIHNSERGFYDDAVWAIKSLIKHGFTNITTTTVITEENAFCAADTIKWLISLGIKDVRYQPVFLAEDKQKYTHIKEAMKDCASIHAKSHTEKYISQCQIAYGSGKQLSSSVCQMGKMYFVCDALGNLSPCFHREDVTFGNILTDSKQTIDKNISNSIFSNCNQQTCFGKHCVSLFDNPICWR